MNTDPIADLLTRIRNASRAGHSSVRVPFSQMKKATIEILEKSGFVGGFQEIPNGKFVDIEISLLSDKKSLELVRKSKPGQRIYISASKMRPVKSGHGIGIVSTSQGIMTTEDAKSKGIGGEYICEVY